MEKMIDKFKEKVSVESEYSKVYSVSVITSLLEYYDIEVEKMLYPSSIKEDPLNIASNFYQNNFPEYYEIIKNGLDNNEIIIGEFVGSPRTEFNPLRTFIKLSNNDRDVFMIVHELAHYIDLKLNPHIISDNCKFYGEVVPFYVEKVFETFYKDYYEELIRARKNNRIYYEKERLNVIKLMLKYEEYYRANKSIDSIIDEEEIRQIMKYESCNTVNSLIRYPLANLLSSYMLVKGIPLKQNLQDDLKNINIYEVIKDEDVRRMVLNYE